MSTATERALGGTARWFDDRLHAAKYMRKSMRKVFPDHWSFMLGEIALYSFIILILTGVFLTFFFEASIKDVVYNGNYVPLKGVTMSEAYASTLNISFDVRGGLVMRQIHHWAALVFIASMVVHLSRVFFTGAFRKPRELNWLIGVGLLTISLLEGFAGYSLPDDLLSGTGLRIAFSIVEAIPVVGTYFAFFLFGGDFPGPHFIPRLYAIHILLIPGILMALITAHMLLIWYQKHTDFAGPGKTEDTVEGAPMYPAFAAKTQGFFFLVFGVLALLGGLVQINPIWLYGPYDPAQVGAGSQPDWYIGWLDGTLRLMPNVETNVAGHTISWNILVPAVLIPGLIFTLMALYPFLEQWVTGDRRWHNVLDRPRHRPNRTAIGVVSLVFYLILLLAGGNDIIAHTFSLSVNELTWFFRGAAILLPPIVFYITRRICIGLQRYDHELLTHGIETGTIRMTPGGEFYEESAPLRESAIPLLETKDSGWAADKPERQPLRNASVATKALDGFRERLRARFAVPELESPHDHHGEPPATAHELEPGPGERELVEEPPQGAR
jgi:ubiquinol-cytochrome c reductase cytochrome b subunit